MSKVVKAEINIINICIDSDFFKFLGAILLGYLALDLSTFVH